MENTKEFPKDMRMFDTEVIYELPMIRSETAKTANKIEDTVECYITAHKYGYYVNSIQPGYNTKFFYDTYFEWLLKTGYIKQTKKNCTSLKRTVLVTYK